MLSGPTKRANDWVEPRVLLGAEAALFASEVVEIGRKLNATQPLAKADVVVVLFEPAGLVRLVLIDTVAKRKAWSLISVDEFIHLLNRFHGAA